MPPVATLGADMPPASIPEQPPPLRWLTSIVILTVAFTLGNATWAAWDQGITYDEYYHLEWPRRLLEDRTDDRTEAFRFDSKTPALVPAAATLVLANRFKVEDERVLRFLARLTPLGSLVACFCL
ncbi:MAG: hypothetical protein ABIP62_13595, partial [Vicinamibacteria bacterium]